MRKFALKVLKKRYSDLHSGAGRAAVGKLSGTVGIFCNAMLFAAKLTVGLLSGSVSVMADAVNNLSDAASSLVTLLGFKLAEKPADREHPYGHARYEYITALAVAALILVIGYELAKSAVEKIINPTPVSLSLPMTVVILVAMGVKLWMWAFNRGLGKAIDSQALLATATDSRNDVIATAVTLAAALAQPYFYRADGIMGLGVALFVLYSGITLAKETISPLLGEAASPELKAQILQEMTADPRVLGHHDLMVHDYGPGQRFGSIHLEMDAGEDPVSCHAFIDKLEHNCLEKLGVHMVIHYDPIVTDDPVLTACRTAVEAALSGLHSDLSCHDLHLDGQVLHLDVLMPQELDGYEEEITQTVKNALADQGVSDVKITFDLSDS